MTQKEHCEQIRRQTKGLVARYLNKRISLPISRFIVNNTHLKPNQITYFNMFFGWSSGVVGAQGTLWTLFLAALILQTASILDGVDGEVAKLTGTATRWGQWLDTISDNTTFLSFLVGYTIGLHRLYPDSGVFTFAVLTFASVIALATTMIVFLRTETDSGSFVTYDQEFLKKLTPDEFPIVAPAVSFLKYLMKKDFYSFVFFLMAMIRQPLLSLQLCAYGGLIACGFIAYINAVLYLRKKSSMRESIPEISSGDVP